MKTVVITGVSTGIGWSCAKVLLKNGYHVFGSVRKTSDAETLKQEFGSTFTPLIFDVTNETDVKKAATQVRTALQGKTLSGLVNNAGIAVGGPLFHLPVKDFRNQLEINLVGPLIVTQAFGPLLGADRTLSGDPGRIINMSSVAGKIGAPFLGAYTTSKHGLEGFSESLRRELMLYGIDVILVGPGSVVTPIWDKAEETDVATFVGTDFAPALKKFRDFFITRGKSGYPPEKVAETVLEALTATHPKVRYAVVSKSFVNWTLPRLLPKRIVDKKISNLLGLKREKST
jgi:NAD(P)-dependent dehydrogenase (short-subunit alcohol dehydrogenase family)